MVRLPSSWAIICDPLRNISRKLGWQQSSWKSNQCLTWDVRVTNGSLTRCVTTLSASCSVYVFSALFPIVLHPLPQLTHALCVFQFHLYVSLLLIFVYFFIKICLSNFTLFLYLDNFLGPVIATLFRHPRGGNAIQFLKFVIKNSFKMSSEACICYQYICFFGLCVILGLMAAKPAKYLWHLL